MRVRVRTERENEREKKVKIATSRLQLIHHFSEFDFKKISIRFPHDRPMSGAKMIDKILISQQNSKLSQGCHLPFSLYPPLVSLS